MTNHYDCTVIGGGPTGCVLSILLAQRGLDVLLLEKDATVYPLPRAVHLDHEIMRVLQEAGVIEQVLETVSGVERYVFQNAHGETLVDMRGGGLLANSGYLASNMFFQPELEDLLRRRIARFDNVTARFGATATAIHAETESPVITFEAHDGRHTASSRFVVGADGATSFVRRSLGFGVVDLGFDEPWVVIDTTVKGDIGLPHNVSYQFCDPKRPITCVPAGPGRRRWEIMLLPGESPEEMGRKENVLPLLDRWGGEDKLRIVRIAVYRFHALIASPLRIGNVFLAGDAAHQMPPFMGQGLCSGIRDAANLAWKIARVVHAQSVDGILDSYEAERAPHVKHVVDTSVAMGKVVCELDEDRAAERDRQMIEALKRGQGSFSRGGGGQVAPLTAGLVRTGDPGAGMLFPQPGVVASDDRVKMDERFGTGSRLAVISADFLPADAIEPVDQTIVLPEVEASPPSAISWLEYHGVNAALVRPDHYVFGTATSPEGVAALIRDYRRALA